ncbi:TonB-dependent receptor [Phenylobacterium sp.]|uniref:TonB-dependent receptor n=1 Tax=Phenylobacterium sp. TaxID=1871053 RepID=UPI00286E79C9|nr:TonB-dependent receptor [Phenylobacterium sp.]
MTSMKRLAGGAALSALALAMSSAVYAQDTTSAVRGQLTGDDGSIVRNASVTLVHTPSGTRSVTAPNTDGVFDARGLRIGGPYSITVTAPGYETKTLTGINLAQGDSVRLDFDLIAQTTVDEFVVTAARDVTSENSGANTTLGREGIESVVSVTRDIRDLARRNLLASANTSADGGISIAGSNPKSNRITIDGSPVQDDFGLNSGGVPTRRGPISLDAIEQFTIQSVPYDVQNGDFQGGSIDIVLRSGTNDFHGSVFTNYLNDGMVGDSLRDKPVKQTITQTNYGAFLAGPILQDKLFFALSYELYETSDQVGFGPAGQGFPNSFTGITQAQIDQVTNILNNTYATDFDPGIIPRTGAIIDEKYSAKVDWNISDNHRASFTYRYALSESVARSNLNNNAASLSSNFYLSGDEDYSYVGELNSRWTDQLTTQLRVSYRDYERRQNPPAGQEFAELQICSAATSNPASLTTCESPAGLVRIGPDSFRQANELETHNFQVQAKAEYSLGEHLFKVGFESQNLEIVNLFVPDSDGVYYFDSIADFQAGRANRLVYSNAPSGNPRDAAALFEYQQNSLYFQDILDVTEDLQVTAGFRYDWYKTDDKPILNPNFTARNGFSNQQTYDGLSILMPRVAFNWKPEGKPYRINGGFGLFSGGVPDVLISTAFSTTGFAAAGVNIVRNANGTFSELGNTAGFTQANGASGLNINVADPRFGYDLPTGVTSLVTPAGIPAAGETIAFTPGFQTPSSWKFFLSGQYDLPWDTKLSVDFVQTTVRDAIAYKDLRARPLVINGALARTPDGRVRYDGLQISDTARAASGIGGTNAPVTRDLLVYNTEEGKGYVIGVGLQKDFDFGLSASLGYARQRLEEETAGTRFGTTAGSLYASQATGDDFNRDAYGRGYEEVSDRAKFELSYKHEFVANFPTRFSMFGETRTGRPVNATMGSAGGNRSPTFGTNRSAYLLYVPDIAGDTNKTDLQIGNVFFDTATTRDNFVNAVNKFDLGNNGIVEKGSIKNPDVNQLDLQISQEFPGLNAGHKFKIVFDIQNVLNLVNDKWGIVEEYGSTGSGQGNNRIIDAACANAAGVASGTGSAVCDTYRYSNFSSTATTRTINNDRSLWYAQVTLRYEF